ncbi:MAG TPA: HlyD family efflux transporter periplasmic adaptor subunit [Gemmatimonadaceae bacterium]|nr:HlyD family efflux transporter periplasmic adaptor subunit [Gemmatimonadaceae bacterium]
MRRSTMDGPGRRLHQSRRRPLILLAATAVAIACARDADGVISGTGTLEVVEVDIAPLSPARVVEMRVDEGATVHPGDTLVTLTLATLGPEIDQRRARVTAAEAALRELERGPRQAEIDRAQAELRRAESEAERTAADVRRAESLAASGGISAQQLDDARSTAAQTAAMRDALRETLRLLQEGTRPERIAAARADVATARATLRSAEATASDLVLTSPIAGVVLARHAQPGEVLGAGVSALTIGEVARPWTRIFLSQKDTPRLRVGQRASAYLDDFPTREFAGRIVAISPRAEFTPRVALTEDERADLLFAVKIEFDDPSGMLKPGLPVTVRIAPDSLIATRR